MGSSRCSLSARAEVEVRVGFNFANGCSLAYCELYLLLALLVVRVFPRMRLYGTTEADVAYDHDFFNPFPVWESKGVRVVV